jgi:RNA polymerase-binding transcription factor DksA
MADLADLADRQNEMILEAQIAAAAQAARGLAARAPRATCDRCGDPLAEHRQTIGRCVACQSDMEQMARLRAVGF